MSRSVSINDHDLRLGFDPAPRSAGEVLVWAVPNFARPIDPDLARIGIRLVGFHRENRLILAALCVGFDDVLVDVNPRDHFAALTVMPPSSSASTSTRLIAALKA